MKGKTLHIAVIILITLVMHTSAAARRQNSADTALDGRPFGISLIKDKKSKRNSAKPIRFIAPVSVQPSAESGEDEIRVDTVLVAADVMVLDKKEHPVRNLTAGNFRIYEDGARQEIAVFARSNEAISVPRSIVLIIDHSGSQLPYLENSIEAAKTLVDQLGPADRMAIVTDDVELLINFTTDKELLKSKLQELKQLTFIGKIGKSSQCSALLAALNELFRGDEMRPAIIFQTDGDELPKYTDKYSKPNFTFESIVEAAERSGVTIFTVIPGASLSELSGEERLKAAIEEFETSERIFNEIHMKVPRPKTGKLLPRFISAWADARARDEKSIKLLAERTGGISQNLASPERAAEVYAKIFANMSDRYLIGYYPTEPARDGRLRRLKIEVSGPAEYRIRGRSSYTPPAGN